MVRTVRSTPRSERRSPDAPSSRVRPSSFSERRARKGAVEGASPRWGRLVGRGGARAGVVLWWVGALWMRTQMGEDSFTAARLTTSIARLEQDVQDRQTKLDSLNAGLPDRAFKLGLGVSSSSVDIDLSQPVKAPSKDAK